MGNKNIFSKIKKNISKLLDSKLILILVLFLVFIAFLYMYIKPAESDANGKCYSEEVVAYVDGRPIIFEQIEERAEEIFYFDKRNIIESVGADVYKKELVKYVIYEDMLYKKAKEENVHVTKKEIEDTYYNLKKFITDQLNLNEDEFKSRYVDNQKRLTKSMRKSIKAYKYLDNQTKVDNQEAKKYYEANKEKFKEGVYRDIFISTVDSTGKKLGKDEINDATNRAYKIYKKLEEGADFEELENKYSEDIKGTIPGGLGGLEMDFIDEDIQTKVSELEVGECIEKPLKSSYGYHIIKRVGTDIEPFDKVKEEIKSMLTYKKQIKLMEGLMKEYKVEFTDEYK